MDALPLRAALVWLAIVPLAVLNGALRELLLVPMLGAGVAVPLSGLLLALVILAMAYATLRWIGIASLRAAVWTGIGWLIATVAFELGFGLLVRHEPLEVLLSAYDPRSGNLWSLVLLAVAVAPAIAFRLRTATR